MLGMPALPFVLANLFGSIAWASVIGTGGYVLGDNMRRLSAEIQWVTGILVVVLALGVLWAFKRYERRLEDTSTAGSADRHGCEPR